MTYRFSRTPRTWRTPQKATGDNAPVNPHHRLGSALAHDTAGSEAGPGNPRRSVGRSSHTPRDGRTGDRPGRPGTLPPVPGRLALFRLLRVLYAVSAAGALLFVLLTWQVAGHGVLLGPDRHLLHAVLRRSAAHPGLNTPAHYLCKLGNIQAAVPVLFVAVCAAAWWGRRAGLGRWWLPPLAGALVMALVPLVVVTVKDGVHRPPPGSTHPDPSGYGWFPSGHTATSSVAYGAALLLLLPWLRGLLRRILVAGTALLVLAVGVALVWCDYHWPLDVAASWCLAAVLLPWVTAAGALAHRPREGEPPVTHEPPVTDSSGSPG
ncbi:phosphatase PAP2 family protein [Streptomyces sp. KK5PA1]|uniref:Phosphatase PAP2 family protein n=1 Tax=Actinacidiphila acididurans TaxID=2784346 RepID=A0ABS2TPT1_9ACTN|nr:phosphatase PAP2 family protein [Actinacidiphila acididurans]